MHSNARIQSVLIVAALVFLLAPPASAQEVALIDVCYNDRTGVLYLIDPSGSSGLRTDCANPNHLRLTITDGAGADHGGLSGLGDDDHPQYVQKLGAPGGDLQGTYADPQLRPGSVGPNEIAAGAVRSGKIAPGAVGPNEIAAGAVRSVHIALGAVGESQIATNAVGSSEIRDNAVGSSEIASGAVGSSEIDDRFVQRRVTGECTWGAIREIRETGSVACREFDLRVETFSEAFVIPFGGRDASNTVTCPDGKSRVGGGFYHADSALEEIAVDANRPSSNNGWNVVADNTFTDDATIRIYVVCVSLR